METKREVKTHFSFSHDFAKEFGGKHPRVMKQYSLSVDDNELSLNTTLDVNPPDYDCRYQLALAVTDDTPEACCYGTSTNFLIERFKSLKEVKGFILANYQYLKFATKYPITN